MGNLILILTHFLRLYWSLLLTAFLAFNAGITFTTGQPQYQYYNEFGDDQPKCVIDSSGIYPQLDCFCFTAWPQVAGLVSASNANLTSVSVIYIEPERPLVLTGQLDLQNMSTLIDSKGCAFFEIYFLKSVV
jgi:hypothetical protein